MQVHSLKKSALVFICLLFTPLTLSGCVYGLLYTDIKKPLVLNMKDTLACTLEARGDSMLLQEPFTVVGLRVEWSSRAIGDIAKHSNLEQIYYADMHTFSILGGLYQQREAIVYGISNQKQIEAVKEQ